jgi:hypothetical protein
VAPVAVGVAAVGSQVQLVETVVLAEAAAVLTDQPLLEDSVGLAVVLAAAVISLE